jgi:N-hydroxyarylamine O-acetyltransferase
MTSLSVDSPILARIPAPVTEKELRAWRFSPGSWQRRGPVKLATYLERVGFEGAPRPDLETLRRLHRNHLEAIPYEALDVQLGRPVSLELPRIYEKLVERGRGGWCYEMCGLFGWALQEIGFSVTRVAGGVGRSLFGEFAVGNHLVLRVDLDRPYLADTGFGEGLVEPVPIEPAEIRQRFLVFRLEELADGWWRLHNHPHGGPPSFDFRPEPAPPALLAEKCAWLQTNALSPFVQNAVCQRHFPDRLELLRGKVLRTVRAEGVAERTLASADEYVDVLRSVFALDLPEAASLWPRIEARHAELALG